MVKMIHFIKEFARFLIHPDAVPRCEEELDFVVESSTRTHSSRHSPTGECGASAALAKISY
jgi:hypothetical protein